jgi:hypothetical protein
MKKRRQAPAARIASPDVLAERGAEDLKAERFKEAVADCPLTPAEFQTIAETLARAEAFDLLGTYAKAAGRRDPSEPLYDFYRVFARTKATRSGRPMPRSGCWTRLSGGLPNART